MSTLGSLIWPKPLNVHYTTQIARLPAYQEVHDEFSEHAMHTGWNDAALYGEFYQGLSECIKDQLLSLDFPEHSNNSRLHLKV